MTNFHGKKAKKKIFFLKKEIQNGRLKKTSFEPHQCPFHPFYKPKDQSMKFSLKNIENWRFWKMTFFWVGHFGFFFFKKTNKSFASFPWKSVNIYRIARMGQHFDDYPGIQQIHGMPILLQKSVPMQFYICNLFYDSFLHGSCHFVICHIFAISDKMSRKHDYWFLLHSTYYKLIGRYIDLSLIVELIIDIIQQSF